jgi:hypothetical protein
MIMEHLRSERRHAAESPVLRRESGDRDPTTWRLWVEILAGTEPRASEPADDLTRQADTRPCVRTEPDALVTWGWGTQGLGGEQAWAGGSHGREARITDL